jgi:hypothetical protein
MIEVGDVGPAGFVPWTLPIDQIGQRIQSEWSALGRNPVPGDIGWLSNTAEGDRFRPSRAVSRG